LRIPAEDPRRFGSDSDPLLADPVGYEVRFGPLVARESPESGEENPPFIIRPARKLTPEAMDTLKEAMADQKHRGLQRLRLRLQFSTAEDHRGRTGHRSRERVRAALRAARS
jgi:hypothetical protein